MNAGIGLEKQHLGLSVSDAHATGNHGHCEMALSLDPYVSFNLQVLSCWMISLPLLNFIG